MADELPPELEEAARQLARQLQGNASAMSGLNSQVRNLVNTIANGAPVTRDMLKQLANAGQQATNALQKVGSGAMGVVDSMVKITGSLGRGKADFDLFNTAIRGGVSAVGMLGGAITGITGALANSVKLKSAVSTLAGGTEDVAKIVGDIGEYMVGAFDDGIKSFIALSKVGGVGAEGLEGLAKQVEAAGLPLQRFQAVVQSNSSALAEMGGTVSRSAGIFADELGNIKTTGLDQQLRNLGMSSDEIADTMINYADLQRIIGNNQYMDAQRLRQGTIAYGKELDEIARITGTSREQAAKAAQDANRNARYLALERQLMSQNKTEELANLRRLNAVYKQHGLEKGFQDMATGMMNTKEATQLFMASQGQAYQTTMAVKNGQMGYLDALKQTQVGMQSYTDGFGNSLAQAAGDVDAFGSYGAAVGFAERDLNNLGSALQEQEQAIKKPNQQTQDLMESFKKLELASSKLQATFLQTDGVPMLMNKAATSFVDGANLLSDAIKGISNWLDEEGKPYESPPARDIAPQQRQEQIDKLAAANQKLAEGNALSAEQRDMLKQISNPPATAAPDVAPGYSPTNPEPGTPTLGDIFGLGTDNGQTTPTNPAELTAPTQQTNPVTPPAELTAPTQQTNPVTPAGPSQKEIPSATPATPQDLYVPKPNESLEGKGMPADGWMNTLREWLGEAKETNSKIDQLIAETKKNGMYTRNA
jgi:hypothetical protein